MFNPFSITCPDNNQRWEEKKNKKTLHTSPVFSVFVASQKIRSSLHTQDYSGMLSPTKRRTCVCFLMDCIKLCFSDTTFSSHPSKVVYLCLLSNTIQAFSCSRTKSQCNKSSFFFRADWHQRGRRVDRLLEFKALPLHTCQQPVQSLMAQQSTLEQFFSFTLQQQKLTHFSKKIIFHTENSVNSKPE